MGLRKTHDPSIDPGDPWANDDLNRRREGELLTKLIESLTGTYVIAVKGGWGTGKSVFLSRLSANLENSGIPVIPINVWRTDYLEDPLVAFVAATEERIAASRDQSEHLIERGKLIVSNLAKCASLLTPAIAGGFAEIHAPGTGAAVADALKDGGQALLDSIRTKKSAEIRFREQLGAARDLLTGQDPLRPVKPIVVTIDELDRCRPNYAIKVLERIKHYFDAPGVIFVIATDGTNLPNAVASVYGEKIDGELYLRKFFDYEFDLSEPDPNDFIQVLADQFDLNSIIDGSRQDRQSLARMIENVGNGYSAPVEARDRGLDAFEISAAFPFFARNLGLSLRDQSQAFTLINAYLRTLPSSAPTFPAVLSFVYCLRFYSPSIYQSLRLKTVSFYELYDSSPGVPPLVAGMNSWMATDTYGWEMMYFGAALKADRPERYLEDARSSAMNERPQVHDRLRAVDRLLIRARAAQGTLTSFLPRAFALADAFSQPTA